MKIPALLIALILAPVAVAAAPHAVILTQKTSLLDYRYQWPAAAAAIPKLDARLRADAKTLRRRGLNGARADKAARPAGAPFFVHVADKRWTVEGSAGPLLSLRGSTDSYAGGAHGMRSFEYILWDRQKGHDVTVTSLFADGARARADIAKAFCPALDAERARRRGDQRTADPAAWQNQCPDLAKQVLLPSAVKDGRFTAFCALLPPYEAGPYAEGVYEIGIGMTPALIAQLKPAYRAAFAVP